MQEYSFKHAQVDHTLFYKRNGDYIAVIGSNANEIEMLSSYLAKEFEIKDLGNLKYFLDIKISQFKNYFSLNGNIP